MVEVSERVVHDGPYFEDFEVGQLFTEAPALTLTSGHAAMHQALVGDRLRLALDAGLCARVTGEERLLAHPSLVCDVAIGQSTEPSRRVLGNLFYRGLVLLRPVFVGDTLRTTTEIVALKQNRPRGDGGATGLAVFRIRTSNQHGAPVLDFWRCPMIPLRDAGADTGHADGFDSIPDQPDPELVAASVPGDWDLKAFRDQVPGHYFAEAAAGTTIEVAGRDTVSAAPELARLTLNVAKAHTDPAATAHGRRLVYGGFTIAVAAAHATRALPNLVTILAWRRCDHLAPVFEGDVLATEIAIADVRELETGGGLVELRARVEAERASDGKHEDVLEWTFTGLMA